MDIINRFLPAGQQCFSIDSFYALKMENLQLKNVEAET